MTKKLRGQTATIELKDDGGTTIPVAILDNPEIEAPDQTVEELRGAGSTEWKDLMKTETAVPVSGEVSAFDLDAWDQLVDYDSTAGKLDDTAEVATFEVTFTFEAADGSTKSITVADAYVDGSIPLGGSREEWIGMDLSLRGRTITDITNTDAAA